MYTKLKNDVLKLMTSKEADKLIKNLKNNVAFREKEILKNYDSIEKEGSNIINVYAKNGEGFGIDLRSETIGNICN